MQKLSTNSPELDSADSDRRMRGIPRAAKLASITAIVVALIGVIGQCAAPISSEVTRELLRQPDHTQTPTHALATKTRVPMTPTLAGLATIAPTSTLLTSAGSGGLFPEAGIFPLFFVTNCPSPEIWDQLNYEDHMLVIVDFDDTLSGLAECFNLDLDNFKAINGISSDYVRAGTALLVALPQDSYFEATQSDLLMAIAARALQDIVQFNNLETPSSDLWPEWKLRYVAKLIEDISSTMQPCRRIRHAPAVLIRNRVVTRESIASVLAVMILGCREETGEMIERRLLLRFELMPDEAGELGYHIPYGVCLIELDYGVLVEGSLSPHGCFDPRLIAGPPLDFSNSN